ncbi:hypothetical protein EVAR_23814_1 [Eumeta japonica]|uniref:Uncharacterized protein n=1 Tax=Eumeta variegata TaxID=151549 RepID=A0A4C1VLF6_EUMVA|nr:hypothetical protein EVAR_23814_1 [Eumeta japonica]
MECVILQPINPLVGKPTRSPEIASSALPSSSNPICLRREHGSGSPSRSFDSFVDDAQTHESRWRIVYARHYLASVDACAISSN